MEKGEGKMIFDEMCSFHCPRWYELPEISLYMDQVLSLIEKALAIFVNESEGKIATSTMINNYVKHKVVPPPTKKRYNREHLAYLIIVSLSKRVLSMSEICDLLALLLNQYSIDKVYNIFGDELEYALKSTFGDCTSLEQCTTPNEPAFTVLRATLMALANKMLAQTLLTTNKVKAVKNKK